ncbi:hypothetical protein ACHAWF_009160 [Thalassiosira exigua]
MAVGPLGQIHHASVRREAWRGLTVLCLRRPSQCPNTTERSVPQKRRKTKSFAAPALASAHARHGTAQRSFPFAALCNSPTQRKGPCPSKRKEKNRRRFLTGQEQPPGQLPPQPREPSRILQVQHDLLQFGLRLRHALHVVESDVGPLGFLDVLLVPQRAEASVASGHPRLLQRHAHGRDDDEEPREAQSRLEEGGARGARVVGLDEEGGLGRGAASSSAEEGRSSRTGGERPRERRPPGEPRGRGSSQNLSGLGGQFGLVPPALLLLPQFPQAFERRRIDVAPLQSLRELVQIELPRPSRPPQGVEVERGAALVDGEVGEALESDRDGLGIRPTQLGEELALRLGREGRGVRGALEGLEAEVPPEVGEEGTGPPPRGRPARRESSARPRRSRAEGGACVVELGRGGGRPSAEEAGRGPRPRRCVVVACAEGNVQREGRGRRGQPPSEPPLLPRLPQEGEVLRSIVCIVVIIIVVIINNTISIPSKFPSCIVVVVVVVAHRHRRQFIRGGCCVVVVVIAIVVN